MTLDADPDTLARQLGAIAVEAGMLLAGIADRMLGHELKADGSPTSAADLRSERLILERLGAAFPGIPIVSEEDASRAVVVVPALPGRRLYFLVDPLDGTRDYLSGSGEYSVNIALMAGDRPIAAALAAPPLDRVWIAGSEAFVSPAGRDVRPDWQPARTRPEPAEGLVALASRRHGDLESEACLAALPVASYRPSSSAAKFGLIASGEADVYFRCGPTMEWDTAAGDHIVARAGGATIGPDRHALCYGRPERGFLNGPFASFGDPALAARITLPSR